MQAKRDRAAAATPVPNGITLSSAVAKGLHFLLRLLDRAATAPLRFALASSAILIATILSVFGCAFQLNDDAVMAMIASGTGFCNAPDEHLIFSNALIGLALKYLYTIAHNAPWYGIYLLTIHFLAHAALLYSTIIWRYSRRNIGLLFLFQLTIGVYFITSLQFTTTAFFAAQAGALLGLTALVKRAGDPTSRLWPMLVASGGMIVLGALVRFDAFVATAVVMAPVASIILWKFARRTALRAAIAWIASTVALALAAQAFHSHHYQQDPAWRGFFAYNALRVNFNDYCVTHFDDGTKPVFDKVHWSENDHAMVVNWFYDDPKIYSSENLRTVLTSYDWQSETTLFAKLRKSFHFLFADTSLRVIFLLLPCFMWFACRRGEGWSLILIYLASALLVLLSIHLAIKEPPNRVYYPLLTFSLPLTLFCGRCGGWSRDASAQAAVSWNWRERLELPRSFSSSISAIPYALILVAMCATLVHLCHLYQRGLAFAKSNHALRNEIAELQPDDSQLYVAWNLPLEHVSPLDSPAMFEHFHMLLMGWPQHSPIGQAIEQRFQIDDLARALCDRSDVYLISNPKLNQLFAIYAREHQGSELVWQQRLASSSFKVWKPSRVSPLDGPIANPAQKPLALQLPSQPSP